MGCYGRICLLINAEYRLEDHEIQMHSTILTASAKDFFNEKDKAIKISIVLCCNHDNYIISVKLATAVFWPYWMVLKIKVYH